MTHIFAAIAITAAFFAGGMVFHNIYMRRWLSLFPAAVAVVGAIYFAARSQGWSL